MVSRILSLLTLLLFVLLGCQQTSEPIALEELAAAARAGDATARNELVNLLGEKNHRTNDRVYALLLELGDEVAPAVLENISASDRIQREYAIAILGNAKYREAIPEITNVLENDQLGRRYIAAWALGEIGGTNAVAPLIKALTDSDAEVRKYATRSLIKLNQVAVDSLIEFLTQTQDDLAAAAAIRALGDIADPVSLDVLLAQLNGENRAEAVTALGKLKDARAIDALVSVLHDPSWRVRMNAAMGLGPIGTEAQAAALEELLADDVNVVREWAARSLEMMTGKRYTYRNEKGENVKPYNIYH